MWFYRVALRHLYWSAAVLKKFFKLVPLPTLTLVALTLVSQFSRMLAFFLPLKVIILIGSTGTPRYFPDSWAALDRDFLVIALSLATVFFYAVSLSSERLLSYMAEKGAAGVVAGTHKLVLFTNQDEVASQAYQKLAAGLATGALSVVLILLFALVYPGFLLAIVSYVVAASTFVALLGHRVEARSELQQKAGTLIGLLSGIGFMMLFAFMVVDFLLWEGVSFMVALISLLLSRQLLNRLDGVLKDAIWLNDKRLQINAIFFTGHRLEKMPEHTRNRKFWNFLSLSENCDLLLPILAEVKGHELYDGIQVECRWKQSGLADLLTFDVEVKTEEEETERYLLKIFGKRYRKAAMSEADILSSASGHRLPAPELVYIGEMDGFDVHLFRLPDWYDPSSSVASKIEVEWLAKYWKVEPDKTLVNRYQRSHPLLQHRLGLPMFERLIVVADDDHLPALERIKGRFEDLLENLNLLPLVLLNPGVPRDLSFVSETGELIQAHFGNWALEPIGVGVPHAESWLPKLDELLAEASEIRESLQNTPTARIRLCACCSAFEQNFNKQRYADAIALLPDILACLSAIDMAREGESKSSTCPAAGEGHA
ncbi:hypothetical protein HOP62_02655 [Halomonas sp. MCCC 1A17488]|uniref:hypothetical protein n=1 Tax=unclassified Halomonas TaxID=2609666 RepID=UPI0018D26E80|nr:MULTISPECIES: hypothetical protein [unclassified Halomonas]MCE8014974.1 hypothetical protein [Halomonas sp. MCCC 1A17488]MCG3238307.1 hypothetical protein [Halomonas sp. MCCC 1A17488]QPP47940.1 hypothetical protein I4484_11745 [Halomonas sp. SS10-MC5]